MRIYRCLTIMISALLCAPAIAQVDYHKAQHAGRVWQKKQLDNNSQRSRPETNSQGIAYNAPVTDADRQVILAKDRHRYDRLLSSVGKKNADKWLEQMARIERSKR